MARGHDKPSRKAAKTRRRERRQQARGLRERRVWVPDTPEATASLRTHAETLRALHEAGHSVVAPTAEALDRLDDLRRVTAARLEAARAALIERTIALIERADGITLKRFEARLRLTEDMGRRR